MTRPRKGGSKMTTTWPSSMMASICCFLVVGSIMILLLQSQPQQHHHPTKSINTSIVPIVETKGTSKKFYDVTILGAGPAGLSAAMFSAKAGLSVVVLGSQSGLLSETPRLENYAGFVVDNPQDKGKAGGGSGEQWLAVARSQANQWGAHFALPGLLAESLTHENNEFHITTQLETTIFRSKSVIVATGATPRRLNLPLEEALWGKNLHNCAICDGHMYNQPTSTVLVIGGGDAAVDAALYLSRQAGKVIMIHRKTTFDKVRTKSSLELLKMQVNIEVWTPHIVTEWKSNEKDDIQLAGARVKNVLTGEEKIVKCDGAFLMIGATPNTDFLEGVVKLDKGLISLENKGKTTTTQTSLPGVFAAGEVIDSTYRQAITAAAQGAQAAMDAERWLREASIDISTDEKETEEEEEESDEEESDEDESDIVDQQRDDPSCDLTEPNCILSIVEKHKVVVFSKPWCPHCRRALEALEIVGLKNPYVIDLTEYPHMQDIQSTLKDITGRGTVPNVFVGGKSIGGGDETVALNRSGKLKTMLQEVGALPMKQPDRFGPPPNADYGCQLRDDGCVDKIVHDYPLILFSLEWCPECQRMLELLSLIGITTPHIIDLDDYNADGTNVKIRYQLLQKAKSKSVPSLFVGGESLGGFHKVRKLHQSGELVRKLQDVGLL